jgi:ubiquinone biosynthesis protein
MGADATVAERPEPGAEPRWETLAPEPPAGLTRRFLKTHRHAAGLLAGLLVANVRKGTEGGAAHGPGFLVQRLAAVVLRPFLSRALRDLPFPVQLRKRLEALGPTYVKLGQILSLREDLLPRSITEELKHLLDRLPAVPFETFLGQVERELGRDPSEAFLWIDPVPLGSASIAQVHRATTRDGHDVILKVVKPGIAETLRRDALLLRGLGRVLQIPLGRFQPRRVLDEFCDYTLREVDLRLEADNAETFAANFRDLPDVVFPRIFREHSGTSVLCMEFLDGVRPDTPEARGLPVEDRSRLVDLGAASIIRMLYLDGFFHADLHPGNLVILPGARCGFIDLGMVGRFDSELRRTLLYYYYALVSGDSEGAARYLTAIAQPGRGGDPVGFRKEVEEICRRWKRRATFEGFSLAQLILESVARGGKYRMYFPVEMVLMVKALVTFEGVGHVLNPGFDVAAVSHPHIQRIFLGQFSPLRLAKDSLRGVPELIDAIVKAPMLVTEGLQVLDRATRRQPESPWVGIRATLLSGSCLIAGAVLVAAGARPALAVALFAIAFLLAWRRGG